MTTKPEKAATTRKVQPVPKDYGSITPYIIVRGAAQFLDFLKGAFGAVERGRVYNEDGTIGHAEVWIGDSVVMMFDAKEEWLATPSFLTLYVEDCDAVHQRAVKAGARTVTEMSNNAWGDRGCRISDPFGNIWWIQTRVEDVDEGEIAKRMMEKEYIANIKQAQETLDRELRSRK
ncbi:MAG TPA: VOC family protein [Methanotrichaceae archaeon]|nr:VOC family protein [Methanotrichaceae archaeon]